MIKQWTLATLALLLLQSCAWNDDISRLQTPEWNGEIAAPIAKGTISIAQVLDQFGDFSFVDVEPDGTLVVHADFSLGQWALPQFIQLPDLPIPFVENSLQVPFPLPEIERLELKQGFLQYSIRHGGNEALRVDFRIRELLHGGEETRFSVDVPSAGLFQNEIDISGYAFVPQHGRFSLSYDAYFAANGDPATVDQVMLTFHDMLPSYAEGILPELDMALEIDTLDVKIDLGMDLPEFTLNEPRIEFVFESQVGVPGIFSFPSFSLQNDAGENLALIYAPFQDGTTLLRPESPTAWAETRFALDKTNSNLVEMLSQGIPKRLMYEAAITAFPAGSDEKGFITDLDSIKVRVEASSPLAFQLKDYTLAQTIDLNIEMIDLIRSGSIKLFTDNGIPLELDLQVYVVNADQVATDSLFADLQPILGGALVGADGTVISSTEQSVELVLDEALLEAIDQASGLRFEARVSSTQHGEVPVRLSTNQQLAFQLGVKAGR